LSIKERACSSILFSEDEDDETFDDNECLNPKAKSMKPNNYWKNCVEPDDALTRV